LISQSLPKRPLLAHSEFYTEFLKDYMPRDLYI